MNVRMKLSRRSFSLTSDGDAAKLSSTFVSLSVLLSNAAITQCTICPLTWQMLCVDPVVIS